VRSSVFLAISVGTVAVLFGLVRLFGNDYYFFAGYTVLQFIVLGTAWNILGGYCGYVNFGTAAFFALGAYTSVFFHKTFQLPIPVLLVIAAAVSGLVGLGTGYLTLRLRGAFFAIATLALAVVLQTMVVNWNYVGGSRGAYVIRPNDIDILGVQLGYIEYLFLLMALLAAGAVTAARAIERSKLGYGFATIRDDELAADGLGRADPQAQADRDDALRCPHGHGRRALPLLYRLSRAGLGLRASLCGELDRHADDRRHHQLGRPAGRRDPARHAATGRHGHHFVRRQPAAGWRAARRFRHHRTERHRRSGATSPAQNGNEMAAPLLQVEGLGKRFGGFVALDGIDLNVAEGERVGLIGPNGSGKSTLVNCLCGTLANETGSVTFEGRSLAGLPAHTRTRLGMARSFQLPRPFVSMSVADNLKVPLLYAVNARERGRFSPAQTDERCDELLSLVGLVDCAHKFPRDLTQVDMRKLELARAMAAEPKLLIADEAMAGLSHSEVGDIVSLLIRLNERGTTVILIEHIMRAVMHFSQRLVVLVSGKKIADGRPDDVIRDPEVERAYLGQ